MTARGCGGVEGGPRAAARRARRHLRVVRRLVAARWALEEVTLTTAASALARLELAERALDALAEQPAPRG